MELKNKARMEWLEVGTKPDGGMLRIGTWEIKGNKPGPTLAVLATVHGDEPLVIEVVRRVLEKIDPGELKGVVKAIPVVNPIAFQACTRDTPIDMVPMNRVFPGKITGTITEQMAHVVNKEVLEGADALVDLHAGSPNFLVEYSYSPGSDEFACAFGSSSILKVAFPGTSASVLRAKDKPAVIAEFGGGFYNDEHYIEIGVRGVFNCLKHMNMIPGAKELPKTQYLLNEIRLFRPRNGGLFDPCQKGKDLGSIVPKDTLQSKVISPFTFEVLEEFRAPFEKNVLLLVGAGNYRINAGEFASMLGNVETATVIEN